MTIGRGKGEEMEGRRGKKWREETMFLA